VSAAFLTATLAADALRLSAAESALTLFGIPTGREGVEVHLAPLAPREAVPPALCAAPVTLTPDGLYPFTPDDASQIFAKDALGRARRFKLGPSYVEVLVPARDLARVFPRTPGTAPDLLAAALEREPEPGEADAIAVQQGAKSGLVPRTGTAGRPSSMHLVHPEHRRRIEAGEAHASLAAEAKHLREWLRQTHPEAPLPGANALQNAIRYDHPEHLKSRPKINRRG
jgi:hypothetical protein